VGEVGAGEVGPAGFALHAEPDPAEVGGFDQGGADAAHRVDDQAAGWGVLGGDAPRELGQHLAGVGGGLGQVAPGPLAVAGGLRAGPDRQGHGFGRVEDRCGAGGGAVRRHG
jgi:hypothetical protein